MLPSQENHLQMAISAYKTGKISSQLKAAEIFGVPRSTLQDRLRGINSRKETHANGHKLTKYEEESLKNNYEMQICEDFQFSLSFYVE